MRRTVLTLLACAVPFVAQAADGGAKAGIDAGNRKFEAAVAKGDAAAVAKLYAEDGEILPPNAPPARGREAIQKHYASLFLNVHFSNNLITYNDPNSPHVIGKDGNQTWENGEWSSAIAPKGEDCGPRQIRGYFGSVKVREGDTWKVRMATYNLTPAPPPPPTTTIAP